MTFELKSGTTQLQFDMDLHGDDLRRVKVEPMMTGDGDEDSSQFSMSPRDENDHETDMCLKMFETWTQGRQMDFVEQLIARMSFNQHEHIYSILMPILQRDFITALPSKMILTGGKERKRERERRGGGGGGMNPYTLQYSNYPTFDVLNMKVYYQEDYYCVLPPHP